MYVRVRENTFKLDLRNFPKRPKYEQIHDFVHDILRLPVGMVTRLQLNHAQQVAYIKCADQNTAEVTVLEHNEKHYLEVEQKRILVRLSMEDGGTEVKIHDISEYVSNDEIITFLRAYGEVLSIQDENWKPGFKYQVESGVRIAKMRLQKHIPQFVTIQGEETLVTYRNQPTATKQCNHCRLQMHPGMGCTENKRLLAQKKNLNDRLRNARDGEKNNGNNNSSSSYASVLASGSSFSGVGAPPSNNVAIPSSGASGAGSSGLVRLPVPPIIDQNKLRALMLAHSRASNPNAMPPTTSSAITAAPTADLQVQPSTSALGQPQPQTDENDEQMEVSTDGSSTGALGSQQKDGETDVDVASLVAVVPSSEEATRQNEQVTSPAAASSSSEQPVQSQTTPTETTTSSSVVSDFKIPSAPAVPDSNNKQISDIEMEGATTDGSTETEESSVDGSQPLKRQKRGRGRPKKTH